MIFTTLIVIITLSIGASIGFVLGALARGSEIAGLQADLDEAREELVAWRAAGAGGG